MIRPAEPGDGDELNAAVCESFEDLHTWMPWAEKRPTVAESEERVRFTHAQWNAREEMALHLYDKVTHALVGCSGYHKPDWDVPSFEIGYWIRKRFERQGLMRQGSKFRGRIYVTNQLILFRNPNKVRIFIY